MNMGGTGFWVMYIVIMGAFLYFVMFGPQKKERKKKDEMLQSLAIGDYVLTTAGMYGKIIDITSDMVIIEFGGKNCRIPMLKAAIQSVEKPDLMSKGGELSDEAKKAE